MKDWYLYYIVVFGGIVLQQGTSRFFSHNFYQIMMGRVIKIGDIAAKPVKSMLPPVFEGDFQSPKIRIL